MAEPQTPPPLYHTGPRPADVPPGYMSVAEKATFRTAAYLATRLYPGPIGQLISGELLAVDEFGWLRNANSLPFRVRDQVMQQWRDREEAQAQARVRAVAASGE